MKNGVTYPLVICYRLLLKMAIDIVSFPTKNGGSFHSLVYVYQRVGCIPRVRVLATHPA